MAVYYQDSTGAQQWKKALPIYAAAANIKAGAFVMWGAADGTNMGYVIPCPVNGSLGLNFVGITEAPFAGATLDNDPTAGTKYLLTDCTINPKACYLTQYDNSYGANALTATGVGATTVVTSGENNGGGWLMFDNFELHFVDSTSSGTYTTKSATSAAITTANKVAKIYALGKKLLSLTSDFTQIDTHTAAAGSVQFAVLDNFIKAVGFDYVSLDPTKHDGLILPTTPGAAYKPAIYANIQCQANHFLN